METASEEGLLMLGGHLTPGWLVEAYSRGIFPWPISTGIGHVLAWFSPDPRAILELDDLHVSRRLARRMRTGRYRVSFDENFAAVVDGCAAPREDCGGTWITPELAAAYQRLHDLNLAHSVEVWDDRRLVGGVYGVALGGFFSGESMFHRARDASKIAIVQLVAHLRQRGFQLFDVQQWSSHLASLGASEISRSQYLARLSAALRVKTSFR